MNKFIDAKGKNCPMPVIMAKKEIDNGEEFFIVEVDNKIAVENLKKLANSQGFEVLVKEDGSNFKVSFSKGCEECQEILAKVQDDKSSIGTWSIFVGKEIIGDGDFELGKSLMKMFFYTLSESDDMPKSILFMNGGVKVAALNEQVVEHLSCLEEKGVEILVCGACLSFFELENVLKVGKISNMYDISNNMKAASKVITL